MVPGSRKIELFSTNYGIRKGWLSLGNQLGPFFDPGWKMEIVCDRCHTRIEPSSTQRCRYKRRRRRQSEEDTVAADTDICDKCFQAIVESGELSGAQLRDQYMAVAYSTDEPVHHDWYRCYATLSHSLIGVCVLCHLTPLCACVCVQVTSVGSNPSVVFVCTVMYVRTLMCVRHVSIRL